MYMTPREPCQKLPWYLGPIFLAVWFLLYLAVVWPISSHLPTLVKNEAEANWRMPFVAMGAKHTLRNLNEIGPKVVGSKANEQLTVELLRNQLNDMRKELSDYYDFDIDVQIASGNSPFGAYKYIHNVIAKLNVKNASSENYILINSHFDTTPNSPGAGDTGAMVAVMLEVLKYFTQYQHPSIHPLIFLFNGAGEVGSMGAHAFVTQHAWGKYCKAIINLDAIGTSGRAMIIQTTERNSWFMNYFSKVPHSLAASIFEDFLETGLISAETDFHVFRDHGNMTGLDMAFISNGYVDQTSYDNFDTFDMDSLQYVGDNLLYMIKKMGNSTALKNIDDMSTHPVTYYDLLGSSLIVYPQWVGFILNILGCIIAAGVLGVMLITSAEHYELPWQYIFHEAGVIFGVQTLALLAGSCLTLIIAVFMDLVGRSMTWYRNCWLLVGLYICAMLFGMSIVPALYLKRTKRHALTLAYRVQLFMFAHCTWLILVTVILTCMGVRGAYLGTFALTYFIIAVIFNLYQGWYHKKYYFVIPMLVSQILPFPFYTFMAHTLYTIVIPLTGRSGGNSNPDIQIALIAIIMPFFFAGFLLHLILIFRKSCTIACGFLAIVVLSFILALTPLGFPFKAETAPQRFDVIHVHRQFYAANSESHVDESGLVVESFDRKKGAINDLTKAIGEPQDLSAVCEKEIYCGKPRAGHAAVWIPTDERPNVPAQYPQLKLNRAGVINTASHQVSYSFTLSGPDHMWLKLSLSNKTKFVSFSLSNENLKEHENYYSLQVINAQPAEPVEFGLVLQKTEETMDTPTLEIGVASHFKHHDIKRTNITEHFIQSLPDYAFVNDWVATYQRWLF